MIELLGIVLLLSLVSGLMVAGAYWFSGVGFYDEDDETYDDHGKEKK